MYALTKKQHITRVTVHDRLGRCFPADFTTIPNSLGEATYNLQFQLCKPVSIRLHHANGSLRIALDGPITSRSTLVIKEQIRKTYSID